MTIGVLALQGDFTEHEAMVQSLSVTTLQVRTVADYQQVDALIMPGGESTTMSKLLTSTGLRAEISNNRKPILATCAGAILVAKNIKDAADVESLQLVDITVQRNAYGRQLQSVRTDIEIDGRLVAVAFIRAPKIINAGSSVQVLATYEDSPVLVREGDIFVATFHTEVTGDPTVHQLFISSVAAA